MFILLLHQYQKAVENTTFFDLAKHIDKGNLIDAAFLTLNKKTERQGYLNQIKKLY